MPEIDSCRCAKLLRAGTDCLCIETAVILSDGFFGEHALPACPMVENPLQIESRLCADQSLGQVVLLDQEEPVERRGCHFFIYVSKRPAGGNDIQQCELCNLPGMV